jgi:hypothetical protein
LLAITWDRNIKNEFGVRLMYPAGTLRLCETLPLIVGGGLTSSTWEGAGFALGLRLLRLTGALDEISDLIPACEELAVGLWGGHVLGG